MATPQPDPQHSGQETRRRVLEMAVTLREERSGGAVDRFLALLQDRLPLWLRILHGLSHLAGKGQVDDNLLPIARAGIDYYSEILAAAMPAFTSPTVTVRFREAIRDNGLGPVAEVTPLAGYLSAEQRLGRLRGEADPEASARLLLAGCFRHAYNELLFGADSGPDRDTGAEEIVRELRVSAPSDGRLERP
jgi:hypothetical protein